MSVETGVGVACGCLPGCKPLMNKMFPRIFASTHQSSSYPRPSAQDRFKQLEAGSTTQNSIPLQSISSGDAGGRDVIVTEMRQHTNFSRNSHITALPQFPQKIQQPSRGKLPRSANQASKETDEASNASTEFIIHYRKSSEEREGHIRQKAW